ncbi:MAG: nucleoside deaminase [Tenericutes bacterium]|jgi:tRNA(adenine34) deaminase|nr:nucleoside deaminase [Mycoplasmatota bacterium]
MNDIQFMEEALVEAKIALDKDEVPVGCVIVKNGEIIARAHNLKETKQDVTSHAEIIAIKIASEKVGSWRLDGCEIYVNLEPCLMCLGAIVSARFDRLIYGVRDKKYESLDTILSKYLDNFNHQLKVTTDVLSESSKELLQSFFKKLRMKDIEENSYVK